MNTHTNYNFLSYISDWNWNLLGYDGGRSLKCDNWLFISRSNKLSIFQINPKYSIWTKFDIDNETIHRYDKNFYIQHSYINHGMVLLNNRVSIGQEKNSNNIFEFVLLLFGGENLSFSNSFVRIYIKIEQSILDKGWWLCI